jgi:hypothetical protein
MLVDDKTIIPLAFNIGVEDNGFVIDTFNDIYYTIIVF